MCSLAFMCSLTAAFLAAAQPNNKHSWLSLPLLFFFTGDVTGFCWAALGFNGASLAGFYA
jgi:hypothetical protein